MTKELILNYLEQYIALFPSEEPRVLLLQQYLERNASEQLYEKQNFDGHITTSAFIINKEGNALLMVAHKALKKWLQPGGHVDHDISLLASAMREASEETGLTIDELMSMHMNIEMSDVPFDIDSHYIPENTAKGALGHYHHDFRYLFQYNGNNALQFQPDESTDIAWVPLANLEHDALFGAMVTKMQPFI